jgi:hypothetical protein
VTDLATVGWHEVEDPATWQAVCEEANRLLELPCPPRTAFHRNIDPAIAAKSLDGPEVLEALMIWAEQDQLRRSPAGRVPDVDDPIQHHVGECTWHGAWAAYSAKGVTLKLRDRSRERSFTWKKLRALVAQWRDAQGEATIRRDLAEAERWLADSVHRLAEMRDDAARLERGHFLGRQGFRKDVAHKARQVAANHAEVNRLREMLAHGEIQLGLFPDA